MIDVFMLNRFPCRMVELVGWVAGVDEKEKTQTFYCMSISSYQFRCFISSFSDARSRQDSEQKLITVDDGDGKHVLPITVRLPLVTITPSILPPAPTPRQPQSQSQVGTQSQGTHFIPAKERKALRKLAVLESQAQAELKGKSKGKEKEREKGYRRNDIRVGDTLKVRGRIDEYRRGGEWVRVVVVEPGSGGSVGESFFCLSIPCPFTSAVLLLFARIPILIGVMCLSTFERLS